MRFRCVYVRCSRFGGNTSQENSNISPVYLFLIIIPVTFHIAYSSVLSSTLSKI